MSGSVANDSFVLTRRSADALKLSVNRVCRRLFRTEAVIPLCLKPKLPKVQLEVLLGVRGAQTY
eukprot:scaffold71279_cov46-Prasinocladus_malaysianus.AAC.1